MVKMRCQTGIAYFKSVGLEAFAIVLFALPVGAQKAGPPPGGSGGGRGTPGGGGTVSRPFPPPIQPGIQPNTEPGVINSTTVPLPKPAVPNDESCLPWDLSDLRGTSVSTVRLGVPDKARSQYEKGCSALKKLNLEQAEKHLRDAIEKYPNYPAAWVMLGQVFQGEQKMSEAHDACSQPLHVDPTYLPPYLCLAGLLNREKRWSDLQTWSDRFHGMSLTGDMYSSYFRGLALLNLHNFPEAQKSLLEAIAIDSAHHQPGFFFMLAQIYGQQGDVADATLQIQQFMKYSSNREDKDLAKQYLSDLQSRQSAN
jgi:tetratricopeptide (TPR) repeat protein